MPTMTHTNKQWKLWHEGKRNRHETNVRAALRHMKAGNFSGALTPTRLKRGLFYVALPEKKRRKK